MHLTDFQHSLETASHNFCQIELLCTQLNGIHQIQTLDFNEEERRYRQKNTVFGDFYPDKAWIRARNSAVPPVQRRTNTPNWRI